jgi:hypothetical protein
MLQQEFQHDLVLIMAKDMLEYNVIDNPADIDFDFWRDNYFTTDDTINQLSKQHPDKTFIIFVENEEYISSSPNVSIIPSGGGLTNNIEYATVTPAIEKNVNTTTVGIALNRQIRLHRLALISLLYGMELDQYAHVSALHLYKQFAKINSNDILDHLSWRFDNKHNEIKTLMSTGLQKIYNNVVEFNITNDIYELGTGDTVVNLDNPANFEKNLQHLYRNSFVEIVSESWYSGPMPVLSEKYLNSVYGCNFPILISSAGTVAYLRIIGFDVFDDIVNHDYDLIQNPIDRLYSAINLNSHLLTDSAQTIELWQHNVDRFKKNVAFAQKDMYTWFEKRAIMQYKNIISYAKNQ